ncbi:MAG: 4-hydroxy-tetrahydrodipicolinate reductase, partial [Aeromonadaceae bacterium]
MDNQIRVALVGCNGRMGKMLIEAVANNPATRLTVATERPG